jgi:Ca-activated chloride channel family protein
VIEVIPMTFANPVFVYALLLLPAVGLFLVWAKRRRDRDLARLGDPALVQRLSEGVNWQGRRWKDVLRLAVLAALLVALARPLWGTVTETVEQEGVEVMVALDVSRSMLAQDIKPDRLSRAKMEVADLMTRLNGDEIGLVLFSGASFIQFPLTSDYATARTFLDAARPEVISRPGTALGDAMRTAMAGFDANRASQKVMVLITDGEDHEGDAIAVAETAAEQGILVYTIGFGSAAGEPIPEYDSRGQITGYQKDGNGEVVLSRLDAAMLQRIAEAGGGRYFQAAVDGSELDALLAEIDALQQAELTSLVEVRGIERFQIFLLVAVMAMVAIELIPDRIPRRIGCRIAEKRAALGKGLSTAGR